MIRGRPRDQTLVHAVRMADTEGYVDWAVTGLVEPQPMYKMLRESSPVFRPGPDGPVVLSRLADIEMALKRTDVFSSNMDAVELGNMRPLIPLQIDPPEHAKYRRILDRCSRRDRWPRGSR